MSNLIVKEFNGDKIYTFICNNRPCWIANQIVSMFDYADSSTTIRQCINTEKFEIGIEYEVLKGTELRKFKKAANSQTKIELVRKNVNQLTVFYEDGLYGFLQYTDKPIGVEFRKWLRRDVLPEIRETGAYITKKAQPEVLRAKADELERLDTINKSLELVSPLLDAVGVNDNIRLLVTKTLFAKAGINIPIEIKAEEKFYDTKKIAYILGMYSKSNKPAFNAVGEIIKRLDITEQEQKVVWESNGSWQGTVIKYTESVIDKVRKWLVDSGSPNNIPYTTSTGKKKIYHVLYKALEEVDVSC
ncbi:Bro-N domain-containing protein [Clostridium sp. ZBS17]|uniref:BRO-N domain-containing protein n=1 Tax=Clostridium sp. ZBS17 TaxID=2949968 RepID=UPI00207ACAE5|nr:Bro-N domain-containing protein [Clostridium sp. ZBS17]